MDFALGILGALNICVLAVLLVAFRPTRISGDVNLIAVLVFALAFSGAGAAGGFGGVETIGFFLL